ncbi:MAG TPA: D-glycero-beta-D-manno-heptose 1-phosphate adenylyltransferase [Chitinophagaceae bacterium]|nr:D-glycero-beta-D-manno-heptose 1-phosphate adenylyltransferase [Chitinophagaceae bacterium]
MKNAAIISTRIYELPELVRTVAQWRLKGQTVAFTNGVFDLLHAGHIYSLSAAAREADRLIVGVNADESVRRLKGPGRPLNPASSRALILASLILVDAVILFSEDTPLTLIQAILPDVLVKGGDYTLDQVVGAREVMAAGGRVVINPVLEGHSTTGIIEKAAR